MPQLNTANDVRIGTSLADRVYLGAALVWQRAPVTGTGFGTAPFGTSQYGSRAPLSGFGTSQFGLDGYGE